jgi:hypothetical protein
MGSFIKNIMTNEQTGNTSPATPQPTVTTTTPPVVAAPIATSQPTVTIPQPVATPIAPPGLPLTTAIPPTPLTPNPVPTGSPASFVPAIPSAPAVATATAPVVAATPTLVPADTIPSAGAVPPTVATPPTPAAPAGSGSFSKPVKKSSFNLKYVIPMLLLLVLSIGGGVAMMLSGTRQDNRNQASSLTSTGLIQQISCNQVRGYVCDSANFSRALQVAIYYDRFDQANLVTIVDANVNRSEAGAQCGGTTNHGFTIDIPSDRIPAGARRLIVKGIPVGANSSTLNPADMFDIPLADPSAMSFNVTCGTASNSCTLPFTAVEAPPSAISCNKDSFRDELNNSAGQYNYLQRQTNFEAGDTFVYRVTLRNDGQQVQTFTLTDIFTQNNLDQLDFVDTSCGRPTEPSTYNVQTRTLTFVTDPVEGGQSIECGIRMRVRASVNQAMTITNTANVTSGSLTASCVSPITVAVNPTPTPSVSPSPSPTVCGATCTTTAQCPNDHTCNNNRCELTACTNGASCTTDRCRVTACGSTCSTTSDCPNDHTCSGNVCRLTACLNGASCNSTQCNLVTTTPASVTTIVAAPTTVGCNQSCASNADCSSANHICVDTSNGRRCRLDTNISSTTCSPAGVTQTPTQVITPQALPVAGSSDILKAVGVGATAVVLGIVGLLLL